jgi:hypothetical protein
VQAVHDTTTEDIMCGSTYTRTQALTLTERNGFIDDVDELDGLSNVVYFWD